jgi:hypothetical protein
MRKTVAAFCVAAVLVQRFSTPLNRGDRSLSRQPRLRDEREEGSNGRPYAFSDCAYARPASHQIEVLACVESKVARNDYMFVTIGEVD